MPILYSFKDKLLFLYRHHLLNLLSVCFKLTIRPISTGKQTRR
jgi:hypothetical protein